MLSSYHTTQLFAWLTKCFPWAAKSRIPEDKEPWLGHLPFRKFLLLFLAEII